jgi:hypothetical protein
VKKRREGKWERESGKERKKEASKVRKSESRKERIQE